MTLPQPIRATVLFVLLLLTLGAHLACQMRSHQPAGIESRLLAGAPVRVSDAIPTAPPAVARSNQVAVGASSPLPSTASDLVTMSSRIDRESVLLGRDGIVHLEVTLRTSGNAASRDRRPVDMAVILDRSGSMSGSKLEYAKVALRQLIQHLGDDDRLGIVAYDSTGAVLLPIESANRRARRTWLELVDRIEARGSTNMSEGMDLAQDMLERSKLPGRNARVLLLSDGLANAGDASLAGLTRRARRAISGEYALSTMGIGSDFDERLMTQLATAGDGAFYYLAKLDVLATFFEAEFATAAMTVANRGRLRLHLAPGARLVDAMGLPYESIGDAVEVPVGNLYANHERTLWLTIRLPAARLGETALGRATLDFRRVDGSSDGRSSELPRVACVDTWEAYQKGIHKDVWERAVVDEELAKSEERLGDAIASGVEADVDREVARVAEQKKIAVAIGSERVVAAIQRFDSSAASAKSSQRAPAAVRNAAAKSQKTDGYVRRNAAKYLNSDPTMGY